MGRIRTVQVMNITDKLVSKYKIESFTDKYETNKEKMKTFPEKFPSMKILNKVAGSLTREVQKHNEEQKKLLAPSAPIEDEENEEE